MILWTLAVAAILLAGFVGYVRLAGDDPSVWHVDPVDVARTGRPNDFVVAPSGGDMMSPVFEMTPQALMTRFLKVALAQPQVSLLGERDGFATLIQRSALIGYPDYISVRAVQAEGGAQLYIYSRSRYGYGDMGVNKARVLGWLAKL